MNLLPMLNSKIWTFKATFATWLLRSGVKPLIIYASDNKLTLSLFLHQLLAKEQWQAASPVGMRFSII